MIQGTILDNTQLKGDYYIVRFHAPEICAKARAGQFVHVRINECRDRILRRPFSIHNCEGDALSLVYKVVGHGTRELALRRKGDVCDLMGPLGSSFTEPHEGVVPVLVAGGYGAAATYLLTRQIKERGVFLIGARSEQDVLLTDVYEKAGYDVRVATNDGSVGHKGFVTELIDGVIKDYAGKKLFFYGCGPHPMLMAMARLLQIGGQPGELSIDHLMCCGVGACFACVVKVRSDSPEGWTYARACNEGPVFNLDSVYVE